MRDYLVFTLTAAMAAMGDLAGHERRGSWSWPARSAVLGLVAAAMGIRRAEAAALARLEALGVAVAVHETGAPLRDYHTVQTVPSAAVKRPQSRAEALRAAGLSVNTTITLRDYRMGVAYGVALWAEAEGAPPLLDLAAALRRPAFTLYLGRKSCPLSAPPDPQIVPAEGVERAFAGRDLPPFWKSRRDGPHQGQPPVTMIASDIRIAPGDSRELRQAQATDREKWHFAPRELFLHHPQPEGL